MPRSPLRLIAFSLLPAALVLAAVEGGARLYEGHLGRGPVAHESITPVGFQLLGSDVEWGSPPAGRDDVHVISQSLADIGGQGVAATKADRDLRIVFVGGSALGGWGLPPTAIHTGIVERRLQEALPDRDVRVINLGKTGWASPQVRWQLDRTIEALQPDLVVTLMGNNERMDVANAVTMAAGDVASVLDPRRKYRHLAVLRLRTPTPRFDRQAPAIPMPNLDAIPRFDDWDPWVRERTVRGVRALARRTRSVGADLLVSTVPVNHRYHRLAHEWWFLGEDRLADERYRTAHWAWWYDAAPAGKQAMDDRLAEVPTDLAARVLRAAFAQRMDEPLGLDDLTWTEWDEANSDERILRTWAETLQGKDVTDRARSAIAAMKDSGLFRAECETVELLWYAGAHDEASALYESCLLPRMFYRADGPINAALAEGAEAAGAGFLDLDALVRSASDHGVPDFRWFYDYCHYNPRGNVLVGHALARAIAEQLGMDLDLPSPADAVAAYDARRRALPHDLPSLAEGAGWGWDPTMLTALRVNAEADARRGEPGHPLTTLFDANRDGATANWGNWEGVPIAVNGYVRAIEAGSDQADVARRNLNWLLGTPWGAWWLETQASDELRQRTSK